MQTANMQTCCTASFNWEKVGVLKRWYPVERKWSLMQVWLYCLIKKSIIMTTSLAKIYLRHFMAKLIS